MASSAGGISTTSFKNIPQDASTKNLQYLQGDGRSHSSLSGNYDGRTFITTIDDLNGDIVQWAMDLDCRCSEVFKKMEPAASALRAQPELAALFQPSPTRLAIDDVSLLLFRHLLTTFIKKEVFTPFAQGVDPAILRVTRPQGRWARWRNIMQAYFGNPSPDLLEWADRKSREFLKNTFDTLTNLALASGGRQKHIGWTEATIMSRFNKDVQTILSSALKFANMAAGRHNEFEYRPYNEHDQRVSV